MLRHAGYRAVLVGALAALFFSLTANDSEARRRLRQLRPNAASSAGQRSDIEPDRALFRAHRRPANNPLAGEPKGEPTDWIRVDQWPLPYKNAPSKPTDDVKTDDRYRNYLLTENRLAGLRDVQSSLRGEELWPGGLDPNVDKDWYVVRKGRRQATMFFFIQHTEPVLGPDDKACGRYANLQDVVEKGVLTELYALRDCP